MENRDALHLKQVFVKCRVVAIGMIYCHMGPTSFAHLIVSESEQVPYLIIIPCHLLTFWLTLLSTSVSDMALRMEEKSPLKNALMYTDIIQIKWFSFRCYKVSQR